jgi:predicted nucleic acid-binding Zn ribbon protein
MSTQPNYHWCPPTPAAGFLRPQPIFAGRKRLAVEVEFHGNEEGFDAQSIAFEDYVRCQTFTKKQSGDRRLPTPEWALNDAKLRALVTRYYERRAQFDGPQPGTEQERLARAQQRLLDRKPEMLATVDKLCEEYVYLKRDGGDPDRLRTLEIEIQGIDTTLGLIDRGPGVLIALVWFYYRAGLDSVGTSVALSGIPSPMSVRQTLWRLHRLWELMLSGNDVPTGKPPTERRLCVVCGAVVKRGNKTCSPACRRVYFKLRAQRKETSPRVPRGTALCSPACRAIFKDPDSALVPGDTRPPVKVAVADEKNYEKYLEFCLQAGTPAMPETEWAYGVR